MEKITSKKAICIIACILIFIQGVGFIGSVLGTFNPLEQTNNMIWVDFNVTGTISVLVPDTNYGEVPDEAREEARSLLSKCSELKDIDFETVYHTLITSENNSNMTTNTDANKYIVIVSGIVAGDNAEEAKEHFWENVCSGVSGNWYISEIDL